MMHISLDRTSAQPLYDQLAQDIRRRIRSGALPPGARLPPVRDLARQLGVTRLTVHSAYSELQSGGWVEATVGRGTFVSSRTEVVADVSDFGREVSAHGVISDMLRMAQHPTIRSLAMADAAAEFYPTREFNRALDEAMVSGSSALLGYTSSQGDPQLRLALADLLRERGVAAGPDEILVTAGATQGIAIIAQTLARHGETIIVEQPTYLGALNVFNAQGLRVVGVPLDDEGMVVEALEPLMLSQRPRFIYTIPTFQNPSGVCMSSARRVALLALAERYGVPIIEDDIYSRLAYEEPSLPALQSDDRSGLVLHVGSFSKSLMPGIRIGYIAATPQLIGRLVATKQANDLCSPPLLQRALAIFLQRGGFAAHLRRVIPRYRERRDALLAALSHSFPSNVRWTTPRGGFCSWVALPPGVSVTDLYLAAINRGIAFTPGDVFFSSPTARPFLRLAFSIQPPAAIDESVRILGDLLYSHLHRRSTNSLTTADCVPLV